MVYIGDTAHRHEGDVMQNPANDRINTSIVDLINVRLLEIVVTALPANKVEDDNESEYNKTGSTTPVNCRVAEKEVFND